MMDSNVVKSNFTYDYPGYKLETNFNPKGKKFMLKLSKNDCHRLLSGKCSLKIKDSSKIILNKYARENEACYCINLVNSMKKNGLLRGIYMSKHTCGHYSFSDGQHRLCSAAHEGLILPVYIQESNCECYHCYWVKKSLSYRLKSILKRNYVFTKNF